MDAAPEPTHLPSWLHRGDPESIVPVVIALIGAIVIQRAIPEAYTLVPRWPLIALELLLLVVLVWLNPIRYTRATQVGKYASYVLLAAITADNTLSAVVLGDPHPEQQGQR
jgi:hypothetical protein